MTTELNCYIHALDVCSPGLMDWQQAKMVFSQQEKFKHSDDSIPKAEILSARERRRASDAVNLSLCVAHRTQYVANIDADQLRTVFATSDGDSDIFHYLCDELSKPDPAISPTVFHQSLHNSAAGYWGITMHSQQASQSISVGDVSFAGGLLSAAMDAVTSGQPVLLVAYDLPSPFPMDVVNPTSIWFSLGLALSTKRHINSVAKLTLAICDQCSATQLQIPALDSLMKKNSMAKSLPLLACIAMQRNADIYLDYLAPHSLKVEVEILT